MLGGRDSRRRSDHLGDPKVGEEPLARRTPPPSREGPPARKSRNPAQTWPRHQIRCLRRPHRPEPRYCRSTAAGWPESRKLTQHAEFTSAIRADTAVNGSRRRRERCGSPAAQRAIAVVEGRRGAVDRYGGWRCCIQRPLVVQYGGFSVPVQRFSAAWVMVETRNHEFAVPAIYAREVGLTS